MAITKTQRWLDLIVFLVKHHFPVPVDEVMEAVPAYRRKWRTGEERDRAAVRRMFERDKDELRSAGIPIETVQYTIEHGAEQALGYRLSGRDFYLPYLRIVAGSAGAGAAAPGADSAGAGAAVPGADSAGAGPPAAASPSVGAADLDLTADQATRAIDALRRVADLPGSPFARDARSALARLTFDPGPAAIREAPVLFAESPGSGVVRASLEVLTDALRRHARVRFRYHGIARGKPTDRDVAPYGLLYHHGHWYLIGHDATRDAIRVFRVGRMDPPVAGDPGPPAYQVPADFDVSTYARREAWELGDDEPVACLVRFDFPLALWAERNGKGERVEELPGGAAVRRFPVRQVDPFLRWLQSFAGDAVVVDPPELRHAQAELARRTRDAHGG